MNIGLLDMDFDEELNMPLNMELMKISSYYKSRRNVVSLFTELIKAPKFEQVFARCDSDIKLIPRAVNSHPSISFNGAALNLGQYDPLPSEIENASLDFTLYEPVMEKRLPSHRTLMRYDFCQMASNVRLSTNYVWEGPDPSLILIHDENPLSAPNLLQESGKNEVGFKYPLIISKAEELHILTKLRLNPAYLRGYYEGALSNRDFRTYVLAASQISLSGIELRFKLENTDERFIENWLINIMRRVLFLKSQRRYSLLKIEDMTLKNPQLTTFCEAITAWALNKAQVSFIDYARRAYQERPYKKLYRIMKTYKILELSRLDPGSKEGRNIL